MEIQPLGNTISTHCFPILRAKAKLALANRGHGIAKTSSPHMLLSALHCSVEDIARLKSATWLLCTVCWSLYSLPLCSRSPHNAENFTTYGLPKLIEAYSCIGHMRNTFKPMHPYTHPRTRPHTRGLTTWTFAYLRRTVPPRSGQVGAAVVVIGDLLSCHFPVSATELEYYSCGIVLALSPVVFRFCACTQVQHKYIIYIQDIVNTN